MSHRSIQVVAQVLRWASAIGLLVACFAPGNHAIRIAEAEAVTDCGRSQPACLEIAKITVTRINTLLQAKGFTMQLPTIDGLPFRYDIDPDSQKRIAVLGGSNSPVEIRIEVDTGQIVMLTNRLVYDVIYSEKQGAGTTRTVGPTWSQEKVVTFAHAYVEQLLGAFPDSLQLLAAEFMQEHSETSSEAGYWYISWSRTDSKGRLFSNDGVTLLFSEKYGPRMTRVMLSSRYVERDFTLIPKVLAIARAKYYASRLKSWGPAGLVIQQPTLTGESVADLGIVNPRWLTQPQNNGDQGEAGRVDARLAWVVVYKASYENSSIENKAVQTEGAIIVWIDAQTGRFLGGDFQ